MHTAAKSRNQSLHASVLRTLNRAMSVVAVTETVIIMNKQVETMTHGLWFSDVGCIKG